MRRKTLATVVLIGLAAMPPVRLSAQPEIITITGASAFGPLTRPPVAFPHRVHTRLEGVSCASCHHRYEEGPPAIPPRGARFGCAACHAGKKTIRDAYHRLCIECHDAAKRRGGVTGPRICGDCHAWGK